jgi:hypothetical protein
MFHAALNISWHNHWSHSGFLLKDLLYTKRVTLTNTITINYPGYCIRNTETIPQEIFVLCATTDSVTQLCVWLITVLPLTRYPLLTLLIKHWLGNTDSSLVANTIPPLISHFLITPPVQHWPLVAEVHVYIRTQNTLHSLRRNSFQCQQAFLEGARDYMHVRPASCDVTIKRQCGRLEGEEG